MQLDVLLLSLLLLATACQSKQAPPLSPSSRMDSLGADNPQDSLGALNYSFQKVLLWRPGTRLYVAAYGRAYPHYLLFFEREKPSLQRFHSGPLLGQVTRVELADLERDGQPELLIYTQRKNNSALAIIALQADGQKLGEWQLPYLDAQQSEVFDGSGHFSIQDSLLLHHFQSTTKQDSLHLRYFYHEGQLEALDYSNEKEKEK